MIAARQEINLQLVRRGRLNNMLHPNVATPLVNEMILPLF